MKAEPVGIRWQKSSFSEQPNGDCVEIAAHEGNFRLRESDIPDVVATTTPERLRGLLRAVKAGDLRDIS